MKLLSIKRGGQPIQTKKRLVVGGPNSGKPAHDQSKSLSTEKPSPEKPRLAYVNTPDGQRFTALVEGKHGGIDVARLAIPNTDGILLVNDEKVALPFHCEFDYVNAEMEEKKIREFDHSVGYAPNYKAMEKIEKDGVVVDYKDVTIDGFASTFGTPEDRDRDHDYIMPGAFTRTTKKFMENPVMLTDHRNQMDHLAGSFTKVGSTPDGLAVEAKVSNSPMMKHVRFLIIEEHLRSFSIGGLFFFGDDGHAIETVDLVEISLVPVPANPKARFAPKSLTADRVQKAFKGCSAVITV